MCFHSLSSEILSSWLFSFHFFLWYLSHFFCKITCRVHAPSEKLWKVVKKMYPFSRLWKVVNFVKVKTWLWKVVNFVFCLINIYKTLYFLTLPKTKQMKTLIWTPTISKLNPDFQNSELAKLFCSNWLGSNLCKGLVRSNFRSRPTVGAISYLTRDVTVRFKFWFLHLINTFLVHWHSKRHVNRMTFTAVICTSKLVNEIAIFCFSESLPQLLCISHLTRDVTVWF